MGKPVEATLCNVAFFVYPRSIIPVARSSKMIQMWTNKFI